MENYKHAWQYALRNQLKHLRSEGEISERECLSLIDDIISCDSEAEFYHRHDMDNILSGDVIPDFVTTDDIITDDLTIEDEARKIVLEKNIQLIDGVYYCLKEKKVIAIKGDVTHCHIREGIKEITYYAFRNYSEFDIRDILEDYSVFSHNALLDIILPDSLKKIDDLVFYNTSLRNVKLPDGLEMLGEKTFAANDSLETIVLPTKLRTIGKGCFSNCPKLKEVELPQSVKMIKDDCFNGCTSLEKFIFPQTVKSIGKCVFEKCVSLKEIELPHSLETIGQAAFTKCTSLQSIIIPKNVKNISDNVFGYCSSLKKIEFLGSFDELKGGFFRSCYSLKEVLLPNSLVEIGNAAFSSCISLKGIKIPDTVELIGCNTFRDCILLEEFRFPNNLQVILSQAFKGCKSLRVVYANNNIVKIFPNAFDDCSSLQAIVVPPGSLKRMQSIFPKRVAEKLVEIDQFRPETIVAVQHYKKDYVIKNVNRSFLNCFSWKYIHTNNVTLMHPNDVVGPCPKHLIYEREDLLSFETKYQDYYYKIQNDFIQGTFYNLDDEMYKTYAFILFFDLIASYRDNKDLGKMLNQLEILCISCPIIGNYVPEKLMTIIDYKQLTDTSKLMILKAFPGFRGVMSIMDYALLVLNYSDPQIIKLKILEDVQICEIQLLKSYEKKYKVIQEEIIKEVIDLVVQVAGKYDDFSKAALLAAKRQKITSLTEIGSRFLRRCFQEVLRNHNPNIIYGDGIGYGDCGIEKIDEYLKEIMESNTPIH